MAIVMRSGFFIEKYPGGGISPGIFMKLRLQSVCIHINLQ